MSPRSQPGDDVLARHLRAVDANPPRPVDPVDGSGPGAANAALDKGVRVLKFPDHQWRPKNSRPFYVSNEVRPAVVEADGLVLVVSYQVELGQVAYIDFVEYDAVNLSAGATERDIEFRLLAGDAGIPPAERQRGLWSRRDAPKLKQFITPITDGQIIRILARVLPVADGGTAGVSFMPWAAISGYMVSKLEEI